MTVTLFPERFLSKMYVQIHSFREHCNNIYLLKDAIEIRTLLTETICVKEEVNYPIEDVTAESLATTSEPLPATRAQDSEQSSDEELGAEFLR